VLERNEDAQPWSLSAETRDTGGIVVHVGFEFSTELQAPLLWSHILQPRLPGRLSRTARAQRPCRISRQRKAQGRTVQKDLLHTPLFLLDPLRRFVPRTHSLEQLLVAPLAQRQAFEHPFVYRRLMRKLAQPVAGLRASSAQLRVVTDWRALSD